MSDYILDLREFVGHKLLWLPATAAVVFDADDRVLLERRADTGKWALPGGVLDPGEQPGDGVVREIFEETGVTAVPGRLASVSVSEPITYKNGDVGRYLQLLFRCQATGGEARVNDDESLEVGWFALDALPALSEDVLAEIELARPVEAPTVFRFAGVDMPGQQHQLVASEAGPLTARVLNLRKRGQSADPAPGRRRRGKPRWRHRDVTPGGRGH